MVQIRPALSPFRYIGVFNHTRMNKNVEFTVLLESLIRREPINFWMVRRMAEPRPTRILQCETFVTTLAILELRVSIVHVVVCIYVSLPCTT